MATQLNIKDAATVALARRVAKRRGTSVTRAVRDALQTADAALPDDGKAGWTAEQHELYAWLVEWSKNAGADARASGVTMENYNDGIFDYLYEGDQAK